MADLAGRQGDIAPESVLRLSGRDEAQSFLAPHHLEAATRLVRLLDRARMMQRVTLSYDPARIGGQRGRPKQGDLADSAAEARRVLAGFATGMPGECWGVLVDICGFDKGLQQIELERTWPRRSAKLVLRIGLDHLAMLMGLGAEATGKDRGKVRHWLPERPPMFADPGN